MTAADDAAEGARTIAVSVSEPGNLGGLSTFDVSVGVGSTHVGDKAILVTLFSATNGGVVITMQSEGGGGGGGGGGSGDYAVGETVTGENSRRLYNNSLTGAIPPELGGLTSLSQL